MMVPKADSKLTLVIGNKNYSSWSLRPWLFLKKFSLPFNEKRIALFTATSDEELAVYNSNYKVPVLIDKEQIVWDSLSIIEYLSDNYLSGGGWPADSSARAFTRSMSAEMHSSFEALRSELPMNCRKKFSGISLSVAAERDVERVKALWQQCHHQYGKKGPWLAGEFSAVDAMFIPVVLRFEGYGIETNGYVKDYLQTVLEDEWVQSWIDAGIDESEIIEADEVESIQN